MNLAQWLARAANQHGQRPALLKGLEVVANYAEFYNRACGLAGWFASQSIEPGDRVAIFAHNNPDYALAKWAIWAAGAVVVPINARLHGSEVGWIVDNSGAKLAVTSPDLGVSLADHHPVPQLTCETQQMREAAAHPSLKLVSRRSDDLAWLFYTSGTTGRPKGVQITHGMIAAMSLSYLHDVDEVSDQDAVFYGGPMSHGAGLYGPVHVLKGAAHITPNSGGFDPQELLEVSASHGSTSMFLAPTMVKRLTRYAMDTGQSGDGIRTIVYGGGPMYVSDIASALDHFGPKFVQIYGQGECPMAISALQRDQIADRENPNWERLAASVGQAQSTVEIAIADEDGRHLPSGEIGEILVRGLTVMPGYWDNDAASHEALRDDWLWTGDVGFLDKEGYLSLVDRSKDLIISGGSNIYPREVEEVILTHPDILEVSVVGRPHDDWGEEVVAFIVTVSDLETDISELESHCNQNMGRYKRPKEWIRVDSLPKNNYGKVLKTELRRRLFSQDLTHNT